MEANYKKSRSTGMGWAILLICAGALLLLFNLGIIPAMYKPIFISWQMLLIAIGAGSIIRGKHLNGLVLIVIGAIFIYPRLYNIFPDYLMNVDLSVYWPGILIGIGLFLLLGKNKLKNHRRPIDTDLNKSDIRNSDFGSMNKTEYIEKNLIFSSSEQIVLSQNFRGGEGNVMFGTLKIDLRKASLSAGIAQLEINAMFGSAIIYVPSNWRVDIQNSTLFGGFKDNRSILDTDNTADTPCLIITGGCFFGSGEIRN